MVDPEVGPETGGNEVVIRGDNFQPFYEDHIDISNSTFCAFTALNIKVKAVVLNDTRAVCIAPESFFYRETPVELTINDQQYTDDNTIYHYYKPPFLFDVQPPVGPVEGNTTVTVVGSNFNNTGNITCKFGHQEVKAKLKSSSEIECTSPPFTNPGFVNLQISLYPGLYSSPVQFLFYKNPVVTDIFPNSGPLGGFTQIMVRGQNFIDLGHNSAMCVFNSTHHTNATVLSDTTILCDSPSILDKQGYPTVSDPTGQFYIVQVSVDGGIIKSKEGSIFSYYEEPKIEAITPSRGPVKGGTPVTLHGSGFNQLEGAKVVRVGHLTVEP